MSFQSIVIDNGIAVKWFVPEPDSAKARSIFRDYENGSLKLLAPDLIFAEFGNVIWKKHQFQNLSLNDANDAITEFKNLTLTIAPSADLFERAFEIAVAHKRTFYDSLYLALAEREKCEFVTADERLFNAVGASFPRVVWLPDWK